MDKETKKEIMKGRTSRASQLKQKQFGELVSPFAGLLTEEENKWRVSKESLRLTDCSEEIVASQ